MGSEMPEIQWQRISSNRTLVLDGLALAPRGVLFPLERTVDLSQVQKLRSNTRRRISWTVIFLKAYALVAARHPQLRKTYLGWPWPHLLEQRDNVGMVVINRVFENEDRICWGSFPRPETMSLFELQAMLDAYQQEPVEKIFRKQVRFSRMPLLVRRAIWWFNLNLARRKRAKRLGTFTMSSLAGQGTINRFHQTLLTTSLSFGPLDEAGSALLSLICDHRVLDGAVGARALEDLEKTLNGAIVTELRMLQKSRSAAA
ncbi:MAG: hypothetical protein SGJ20_05750 [Planctomycetota bacterium]|nr:hypothetical protein [Planctomycetota bacterium]